MALSTTVTKVSVTQSQKSLFSITLRLVLTDTAGAGFTKDYTSEYHAGANVGDIKKKITEDMQRDITYYKQAQVIYNAAALNTAVTEIKSALVL